MLQRICFCCLRKPPHCALCSVRNALFLVIVITVLWIFLAAHIGVNKMRIPQKRNPNIRVEDNNPSNLTTIVSNALKLVTSTAVQQTTSNLAKRRYLSQRPPMAGVGQGNLMFMYASLIGIAETNKMTPAYPEDGPLRKIFHISAAAVSFQPTDTSSVAESKACAYDAKFGSLSERQDNVTAVGYLQSWKYFAAVSERVRREFTFVETLRNDANEFLLNISSPEKKNTLLYVGAHIRRRDMLATFNVDRGYTVATKEYLVGAVRYFRSQFPSQFLVFVVCSDDIDWAKRKFPPPDNSSAVAFSENRNAAQDLALLAACNHSIITVGTYGWWSAYLAGGRTVYYQNFPTPDSHIASIFDKNDYYPPEWIGMLL